MKVPKVIRTYCPRCKTHRDFSVSIYKKGRERSMSEGRRRYDRKQSGYGGQKKPVQKRFAKTTKKQMLRLACKKCGYVLQRTGIRLRKMEVKD